MAFVVLGVIILTVAFLAAYRPGLKSKAAVGAIAVEAIDRIRAPAEVAHSRRASAPMSGFGHGLFGCMALAALPQVSAGRDRR